MPGHARFDALGQEQADDFALRRLHFLADDDLDAVFVGEFGAREGARDLVVIGDGDGGETDFARDVQQRGRVGRAVPRMRRMHVQVDDAAAVVTRGRRRDMDLNAFAQRVVGLDMRGCAVGDDDRIELVAEVLDEHAPLGVVTDEPTVDGIHDAFA